MRRCGVLAVGVLWSATAVWADDPVVVNPTTFFPEGPVVIDGTLFFAQYAGNVVTRWDGAANADIWKEEGCGPSAVVPVADGFGITCYDSGKIVVISPAGETLKSYDKDESGLALQGPNDGAPDGKGGAWFTLSGPWEPGPVVGRIVHLSADGALTTLADDLAYANGVVPGADGRLYVAESYAGTITSFAVGEDGSLSDRRTFARLYQLGEPPGVFPDGIKVGPNGDFFVGLNSAPVILQVAPDGGKVTARHEFASQGTPNMAFSADGKTMYVMAVDNESGPPYEGRVLAVPLP